MSGSFEINAAPLLAVFVMLAATTIGDAFAARCGVDLKVRLRVLAAATILAARVGYVWQFRLAYFDSPWSMLDVRDGGWSAETGFVALWLLSLWMARRHPALKVPLRAAALSATMLWSFGAMALALRASGTESVELPSLKLSTSTGSPVDLASLRGRPLVVNLWATWCPPCNREMPVLAQAQARHPEVQFAFINQGESLMDVGRWLGDRQLNLHNVMIDPHLQAGAALGQRAFPTSYFFDAQGHLVDVRIGELSAGVLADKLQRLAARGR